MVAERRKPSGKLHTIMHHRVACATPLLMGSFLEFFDTSDHTIDDFVGRPRVKEHGLPSGDIDTIGAVTKTRREP
jgi:hypothetical protein